MEVYTGTQPAGPYQVSNKSLDVVVRMTEPIHDSKRNITMDNWFTSIPLARSLLTDHKLTLLGTLRKDKVEIPPEFLTVRRPAKTSMFAFTKDMTSVSYKPKKNKSVVLLSTMHHDDKIDESTGDENKPEMITLYNATKAGVDSVDQMVASYDVSRNTRR
nr:uncharacterized protein LOC111513737 [Leptinotarsa decemlineata]